MRISGKTAVLPLFALVAMTFGGCITLEQSSTEEDVRIDIRWFTNAVMEDGIIVRERGPAAFELRADESVRMILDGLDMLDVYWFENPETAEQEAFTFASSYPRSFVYRREGLVVVRYTDRAKGLAATMNSIMGARL